MAPWINGGNYVGVDLNPGGMSNILQNYTDAINERYDLFASGETKPQYHTNAGDKTVPVAADFIGFKFTKPNTDLVEVLDDVESGIDALLGDVDFRDPDDLDTQYTTFAQVALDATGSETRPQVNVTNKALWNFYKNTIEKLIVVRFVKNGIKTVDRTEYNGAGFANNQDAWDDMLNATPLIGSIVGIGIAQDKPTDTLVFWIVEDNQTWSYDLDAPSGGTILRDKAEIPALVTGPSDPPISGVTWTFKVTFDGSIIETPTVSTIGNILITYEGTAPSLFGLIQDGGSVNYEIPFGDLPAAPLWSDSGVANRDATIALGGLSPSATFGGIRATMWIDYTSELVFV